MVVRYSDHEIEAMLREAKFLPRGRASRMMLRQKRGHSEREVGLSGASERSYRVILRQSNCNTLDFSVILALNLPDSNQLFRLRRYNGKSHQHTNQIERDTFYDFHIHMATERYQELGGREDAYAKPSHDYWDLESAIGCLFRDCAIGAPATVHTSLFGELKRWIQ